MFLAKRHTASEQQRLLPDATLVSLIPNPRDWKRAVTQGGCGWQVMPSRPPSQNKEEEEEEEGLRSLCRTHHPPPLLRSHQGNGGRTRLVAWERRPSRFLLARHGTPPQSP